MCVNKRQFTDHLTVHQQPQSGLRGLTNTLCFHLNLSLPFYRKIIEREQPDIIHAHFGYDGFRMYRIARKTNTPLVVSFYGSDVSRLPTEFDWKRRYRKLAANAQGFTAASDLMKSQLVDLGFPENKIKVIRFGVNTDKFNYQRNFSLDSHLMMVGRMVEKKGFKYALKTLKLLNSNGKTLKLDLYGDGPLRNKLEELTDRLNIGNQVNFHGYVSIEKIRKELQNHSLLLVPSVTASDDDQEGLPNTILEGMASGIPVIASNHAAIPEAIINGETGFLVPERKPQAIAGVIEKILDQNGEIQAIRNNARKLIEEQYSVKRLVQNTEGFYTKIINDYEE
jgi:glycosyltransferase involved in cell wall biosynthesis